MSPSATARRLSTLAALLALAACQDAVPVPTAPESPDLAASRAELPEQAQQRREAIFQRATPEVLGIPGAVFIDNDERAGRVVVGVSDRMAEPAVRAAMRRLGVAESDFAVERTPTVHFAKSLRDVFRPTVAGIQIHFTQYVCTMGFNVDHAGGRSFITNSHCTARQGGTEGTVYYQPASNVNGGVIATEVHDPEYAKGGVCPKGRQCRYSDASRALYAADVASNRGQIAMTTGANDGSLTLQTESSVFSIAAQDNSTTEFDVGLEVNKVGRTTGWTRGRVTRTCVNTGVSGSTVVQLCQTFVSDPAGATVVDGGDSGSPVFTGSGGSVTLVGILWGGSSDNKTFIFSPLASVQRELGGVVATSDGTGGGGSGGGGGGGGNCNPKGKNCR